MKIYGSLLVWVLAVSGCSQGDAGTTGTDSTQVTESGTSDSNDPSASTDTGTTTSDPSETSDPTPTDEPVDCAVICGHIFACGLDEDGTEAECIDTCESNPMLFPPRLGTCAEEYLAGGVCNGEAFGECAEGPVLKFFNQAGASICGRLYSCCPQGSPEMAFESEEQCVEIIVGLGGGFVNITELMGYLTFDETASTECASRVDEMLTNTACEDLPMDLWLVAEQVEECENMMQPQQGQGDPCGFDLGGEDGFIALSDGCVDGLVCQTNGDDMPTCEPGIATGGDCSEEGAQCTGDDKCVDGVCVALGESGDACAEGWECESEACNEGTCGEPPLLSCNE